MFEKIKRFCDSLLDLGLPGFDLSVYKDGECLVRYMNGYNDLENKVKMSGNEKYNIYSCSKIITCISAMMLYEKGLFSLEDKLSRYLPEFSCMTVKTENGTKKAEKPILIKHLFEMTAGFSYNLNSPELLSCREETNGKCQTLEVMKYLAKEPLLFEPGDRWEYSLCHDVLAAVVEVISGEKFEVFVKKNIFEPLGMNDTDFIYPEEKNDDLAEQYLFKDSKAINIGKKNIGYRIGTEYASGGAGAVSTVDDYIKFLEGVRTFKLIKPETLKLFATDRLTPEQKRTYWMAATHGYGLGVRCKKADGIYPDFGWGGAAGAYAAIDMENGISLYMGSHLLASPVQGIRSMLYRFLCAELVDDSEYERINNDLKLLKNYNLTY